jgi:hypothetical protein
VLGIISLGSLPLLATKFIGWMPNEFSASIVVVYCLLAAFPAIVTGKVALRFIGESPRHYGGPKFAWAGLILGIATLLSFLLLLSLQESLEKMRPDQRQETCLTQLAQIQSAKRIWARQYEKAGPALPTEADLFGPDKPIKAKLSCPSAGEYSYNRVDQPPTCRYQKHTAAFTLHDCLKNLVAIEDATLLWARENRKSDKAVPTWRDLEQYLGKKLQCPAGGEYQYQPAGQFPRCTIPAHKWPE